MHREAERNTLREKEASLPRLQVATFKECIEVCHQDEWRWRARHFLLCIHSGMSDLRLKYLLFKCSPSTSTNIRRGHVIHFLRSSLVFTSSNKSTISSSPSSALLVISGRFCSNQLGPLPVCWTSAYHLGHTMHARLPLFQCHLRD